MISTGIKALERNGKKYIALWTSNAFMDTEQEMFATKAWEDYVDRRTKEPKKERVWFWHIPGTDYADIVWQGMVGHMLVEVAQVDNTARGNKMFDALQHPEQYPNLLPEGWGTSHGYWYNTADKEARVYQWVDKFETTTLPKHKSSNMYGGLKGVFEMSKLTPEKIAALKEMFGDEADGIIAAADKESERLVSIGTAHKEKTDAEVEPEVEPEADQMFEFELDDAALEGIAGRVPVADAVKEALANGKAALVKEIAEALKEPIVTLVEEAVKAQVTALVGAKETLVQSVVSGKVKLVAKSATKEVPAANGLTAILEAAMAQHAKGEKDASVTASAEKQSGDLLDQALWAIRHPAKSQ
jgi:hypothetical protein